jgi:fumarate reductase subunit D
MIRPHRNQPAWWAFALHRLSGVLLALFLPAHFLVLGLALEGAGRLDGALRWTGNPVVKAAEMGLVFLLVVHLTAGLRLLAIEFLPWRDWQKTVIALAGGASVVVGFVFLLNAM